MTKINQLISHWPRGTVKTVKSLIKAGYSPELLKVYSNSGWLELVSKGAYKLKNDTVGWEGAVYTLQDRDIGNWHPGGKTALTLKGYAHYLRKEEKVTLFANRGDRMPKWVGEIKSTSVIEPVKTNLFDYDKSDFFSEYNLGEINIKISSPELALFELLYLVPKVESFSEAFLIFEGMSTLRVKKVQQLLQACNSIKVKRIFMWMAEKHNHQWVKELNTDKIDFGIGKRMIVKNGKLNKKFNITVPKEYEE